MADAASLLFLFVLTAPVLARLVTNSIAVHATKVCFGRGASFKSEPSPP